jgi:hypothetical protein
LKLNRDQLRWVVGLLTGHCHQKGHLFKLWLNDDPICEKVPRRRWLSHTYILCDCEAIAYLRFRHLGQFFMEPSGNPHPRRRHSSTLPLLIIWVSLLKVL